MKLPVPLAALSFLAPAILADSFPSPPKCSSSSVTPCSCPDGTDYWQSVTFAVIGASAADVKDLIYDFYKCAWLGVVPFATQGPDNTPGLSIRTSRLPTLVGTYNITEILTELRISRDSSFIEKFEQLPSTVPVEYSSGNGSFSGYWVTLESQSIFQYETAIRWSIYACETGHARNFAVFHQDALNNATSVLQAQGKILGTNIAPFSVQDFLAF